MLRRERNNNRRRLFVVLFCTVIGVGIGMWHNRQTARGRSDVVTTSVRTISSPFVSALGAVSTSTSNQFGWLIHGRSLASENRQLREDNARLREANARLNEADISAQRLRQQLG